MSQIALITGANRGLGKETARQLAVDGYTVLVTARTLAKAEQATTFLNYKNVYPFELDVARPASVENCAKQVDAQFGRLDVLINNAAINYDTWHNVLNADLQEVRQTLNTNVLGPWEMTQAFLPLLRRSDHARIVNVSSGAGEWDSLGSGTPGYSLSKVSLNALTVMLSKALNRDQILVNAVCPGWVATDMGGSGGRPIPDGASGIVWAAQLAKGGPTGGFFRDGKRIAF